MYKCYNAHCELYTVPSLAQITHAALACQSSMPISFVHLIHVRSNPDALSLLHHELVHPPSISCGCRGDSAANHVTVISHLNHTIFSIFDQIQLDSASRLQGMCNVYLDHLA